jgi:hypothetical protein
MAQRSVPEMMGSFSSNRPGDVVEAGHLNPPIPGYGLLGGTLDYETRRFALEMACKITGGGRNDVAEVLNAAKEIEAYVKGGDATTEGVT